MLGVFVESNLDLHECSRGDGVGALLDGRDAHDLAEPPVELLLGREVVVEDDADAFADHVLQVLVHDGRRLVREGRWRHRRGRC